MAKKKLKKFAEINSFSNVVQPQYLHTHTDHPNRGQWSQSWFGNGQSVVLEIGCGKGEYTVGLAEACPGTNFIGIDIKGDRIWTGARAALDKGLHNVSFLRIQAEMLIRFFAPGEVSGIWLTFPDPYLRRSRHKKRLTSQAFLERYRSILAIGSPIHLKTDNSELYAYTLDVIREGRHHLIDHCRDLYGSSQERDPMLKDIRTYYEQKFLDRGLPIHYVKFSLRS